MFMPNIDGFSLPDFGGFEMPDVRTGGIGQGIAPALGNLWGGISSGIGGLFGGASDWLPGLNQAARDTGRGMRLPDDFDTPSPMDYDFVGSDARLKTAIRPIESALDLLASL
jgi:hypothetical protein